MYAVVFDCESDQLFERGRMPANSGRKSAEEQRREEISRMECTVACAVILYESDVQAVATTRPHSAADERARALLRDSAVRLVCWRDRATLDGDGATVPPFEPLLSAFDGASVIAGYNHLNFDMQLLRKYYGKDTERYMAHRLKCFDPFVVVRALTESWIGLNALLQANKLDCKTGEGTAAVHLWDAVQMGSDEESSAARSSLEDYCMSDVELTVRLLLLPSMRVPGKVALTLPNACCGLASRFAAKHRSDVIESTVAGGNKES